jgi:hypothetical protein
MKRFESSQEHYCSGRKIPFSTFYNCRSFLLYNGLSQRFLRVCFRKSESSSSIWYDDLLFVRKQKICSRLFFVAIQSWMELKKPHHGAVEILVALILNQLLNPLHQILQSSEKIISKSVTFEFFSTGMYSND